MNELDSILSFLRLNRSVAQQEKRMRYQEFFSLTEKKKICLFGTGVMGQYFCHQILTNGGRVDLFCDNDIGKQNKPVVNDILCISPEELYQMENVMVLISLNAVDQVYDQLKSHGIHDIVKHPEYFCPFYQDMDQEKDIDVEKYVAELFNILGDNQSREVLCTKLKAYYSTLNKLNVHSYGKICSDNEYFPEDIAYGKGNQVFVDCGAFTGDTFKTAIAQLGMENIKKYIAYELDKKNFAQIEKFFSSLPQNLQSRTVLNHLGVSDFNGKVSYFSNEFGTICGKFNEDLNNVLETGEVVCLDEHLSGEKVTFIKMDIEGSEPAALRGAQKLIKNHKPFLAICVYHKITHLWEIPLYIHAVCPEYRIYLRHHSHIYSDTVCYAISDL